MRVPVCVASASLRCECQSASRVPVCDASASLRRECQSAMRVKWYYNFSKSHNMEGYTSMRVTVCVAIQATVYAASQAVVIIITFRKVIITVSGVSMIDTATVDRNAFLSVESQFAYC
jgi:hypothetical protein